MYTRHFGLDDGPFHGRAEGRKVYVGRRQSEALARLKKVLALADTAVAVQGPVGAGKTTLVHHALAGITGQKVVVPVDRIRLGPDEVLDLLLARFDLTRPPKGTIQRVAAFRRRLHECLASGTRVFIVVEDAGRVGLDALIELEALTATDSGEPVGANIVLMGGDGLPALVANPALARLKQRIRLRQDVGPFDADDVAGYMRHCLEAAGGILEQIFEPGTTRIVFRYSGGIPRVIDNLCDAALVAAAEAGLATILPEFLEEVAENCGLEPLAEVPGARARKASAPAGGAEPEGRITVEEPPEAGPAPSAAARLSLVETPARPAGPPTAPLDDIPTLSSSMRVAPLPRPRRVHHQPADAGVERRPATTGIDTKKEQAGNFAERLNGSEADSSVETAQRVTIEDRVARSRVMPSFDGDLTLVATDVFPSALGDEREAAEAPEPPKPDKPAKVLDHWAEELSKARSLEDISDRLAETLFGNEVQAISDGIRADTGAAAPAPSNPAPAQPASRPRQAKAPREAELPRKPAPAAAPRHRAPQLPAAGKGMTLTMSQRIEMVNSLYGRKPGQFKSHMPVTEIVLAVRPDEPAPSAATGPDPIEAQIETAITQTRKALGKADLARMEASDDDDHQGGGDDGKGSRGLFGFLRRSSKS